MDTSNKSNLRFEIINNSRILFEEQGYSATTMRQIAAKSGCTAGSIYYFFEEGKAQILQEVVRSYGLDPAQEMAWVLNEASLDDLVDRLIAELPDYFQKVIKQLRWLQITPSTLTPQEFGMMRNYPLTLYSTILAGVRQHVVDAEKSKRISWMLYSMIYGHVEMSNRIGSLLEDKVSGEDLREILYETVRGILGEANGKFD